PADFTPVCTTELGAAARLQGEFAARGVKLFAVSVDTVDDHLRWVGDVNETQGCRVEFPLLDDSGRAISAAYDMLDHQDPSNVDRSGAPLTVRSVFFVDPRNIVRAVITYPASCGR
ncbi:MAG: thioredoxin-like protein, partial [Olpidium bornovanus]